MGEAERGEAAPRIRVPFYCANLHHVVPSFASEAAVPDEWDRQRCAFHAGTDKTNPASPRRTEPYKTNLAYVKERRSEDEGKVILVEALAKLRADRAAVEAHMED